MGLFLNYLLCSSDQNTINSINLYSIVISSKIDDQLFFMFKISWIFLRLFLCKLQSQIINFQKYPFERIEFRISFRKN